MDLPWLLAVLAGAAVVATTGAARHVRGPLAGVLAAAPVTPTVSLFLLGDGGRLLAGGLAAVAYSVIGVCLIFTAADGSRRHALPGLAVLACLGLLFLGSAPWMVVFTVAAAAAVMCMGRPAAPVVRTRARLALVTRFAVGFVAVLTVAAAQAVLPSFAPALALAPWLFAVSAVAATLDGGGQAGLRVLHGGVGGAVGVLLFALTVAFGPAGWIGLALAWLAFAAGAVVWHAGWSLRRPRRRPRPSPVPGTHPRSDLL